MAVQVLTMLQETSLSKSEIAEALGKNKPSRYLNDLVKKLLQSHFLEYTIPDKPNSRLQKYRLTLKGKAALRISSKGSKS